MSYCQNNGIGIYKRCDNFNIGPKSTNDKKLYTALIVIAIILGEAYDVVGWIISLLPVAGDFAGNAIVGNVLDLLSIILNWFLFGNYAFLGITEFVDLFSQWIPGIGDFISLIELIPASAFPVIINYFKPKKAI